MAERSTAGRGRAGAREAVSPADGATPVFRSRGCFVCGTDNPGGLDLAPFRQGERAVVVFTPCLAHRGFSKTVHGGLTAALLDEVIGLAAGLRTNGKCATVELRISYRRPLYVGMQARAEGWYVRRQGRFALGAGHVLDAEGRVLAEGRGRFLPLDESLASRFLGADGD